MLKLIVVQAEFGDCLLLQSSHGSDSISILIDGGPSQTYEKNLKPTLNTVLASKSLNLVILSHIDNDHVLGLLDLFEEIKREKESGGSGVLKVSGLWHNSFNDILRTKVEDNKHLQNLFSSERFSFIKGEEFIRKLPALGALKGVGEGRDLRKLARSLRIPINSQFGGDQIVVGDKDKTVKVGKMTFSIIGPTQKNLDKLRKIWNDWLRKHPKISVDNSDFQVLQALDASIANLSSIMFIVEYRGKKILFTGDGLGDDAVDMISERGLLDSEGGYHVDVMKVPHHGSERNASAEFFNTVTADTYVISANGRDDNPSLATLKWIIKSKRKKNKTIKIFLTNRTDKTDKILQIYDQDKSNYQFHFLEKGSHSLEIPLN